MPWWGWLLIWTGVGVTALYVLTIIVIVVLAVKGGKAMKDF